MELSIIDKKLAMDSRDIAKLTKKKHNIVMRDIREMLEKIGTNLYTSFERTYLDKYGREQKCYYLPHMEKLFIPAHQKELWEKIKPKIYKQTEFDFY